MHTVADVHQPDDTDSGHSSSYDGTGHPSIGGVDNDEYLVPVSLQGQRDIETLESPPPYSLATSSFGYPDPNALRLRQSKPSSLSDSTGSSRNSIDFKSPDKNRLSQGSATSFPADYRNSGHGESSSFVPVTCPAAKSGCAVASATGKAASGTGSSLLNVKSQPNEMPKFQSNTRVYGTGAASASSAGSRNTHKPPPSSLTSPASSSAHPFSRYQLYLRYPQPSEPASSTTESNNDDDANQPLLDGRVRIRENKSRNGVGSAKLMSNTSSGYSSDLSVGEPSPPPDYRAVLEDVTETDITI